MKVTRAIFLLALALLMTSQVASAQDATEEASQANLNEEPQVSK